MSTPPEVVLSRFPLLQSPAQRRIQAALLTALAGPLHETFRFAEAPVFHYGLPLTPWTRDDVIEVNEVIPCLCAWDRFLFPDVPVPGQARKPPTWVCEVAGEDTDAKLALHAGAWVRRAWLVDPVKRSISVFALGAGDSFQKIAAQDSGSEWRLPPFEAVPIATAALWEPAAQL